MYLLDIFKTATTALSSNKKRAALTMLGVVIGITAVIVIMSVGAGAQSLIVNQIKSIGSNLIGILPGAADDEGPPASAMGILVTTLKYDDVKALEDKSRVPHLVAAAGYSRGVGTVTWQNRKVDTSFIGTMASYLTVENTQLEFGRFFTKEEEKGLGRVAVLGTEVKNNLFEDQQAIGQKIKINKETFTVIGIMEKRGVAGFENNDNIILIPVSSAQKLLLGINHLGFIRVRIDQAENVEQSLEDIRATLRERHNIDDPADDDFSVRATAQAIAALTAITDALKFFLAAIAAIALLVGGIGIMNIMYVSVTERTKEIGLRKAVGAKRGNILGQFLAEAIILTFSAGVVGIVIGSAISILVAVVARYLGYDWDLVISPSSILLACGVCIFIGLIFGYYPAKRAANMSPIEALRHE